MMRPVSLPLGSLREACSIVWREATRFVKVRLGAALLLIVATSAMTPLGPVALKMIVDRLTGDASWSTASIVVLTTLYVLSQWLARCGGALRGFIYARAERRMIRTVSERLFTHIMQLPMRYHLDRQTGAIGQIVDNGVLGMQTVLNTIVFTVLPLAVQFTVVAIILYRLDQPVFLMLFTAAAVGYAVVFRFFGTRLTHAARAASTAQVDASAIMTDSILNYETVKLFTAEAVVQEKLGRAFSGSEDAWVRFFRNSALNSATIATIFSVSLAAAIFYSAQQVRSGHMTVGDFVLVNTYLLQIMTPLESLGYATQGLAQGIAMLGRMLELFREKPESGRADAKIAPHGAGRLEFDHVSLSYRSGRAVLGDVSFEIPAAKTLGIVGASGAGKSTLIRLLTRLFEPDSGQILLDGVPIAALPLRELRSAIAVVPQDTVLFNDSIGFNIAFGKRGCTQAEIEQAARVAHLHDYIMGLPEKYDTKVGERGVKLSGGERQRVSIARAAIKRPRIYVFDEATSSLDSRTESEILVNLRAISNSSTTLVIAHRLSTIVHADEIVVLANGAVVERGTHESLLRLGGQYSQLWRAQQGPKSVSAVGA